MTDEDEMENEKEINPEQIKMANHMCLLNLRKNFEMKKKWSQDTDMVMEIVKNRDKLPEISKFAMKVSIMDF